MYPMIVYMYMYINNIIYIHVSNDSVHVHVYK